MWSQSSERMTGPLFVADWKIALFSVESDSGRQVGAMTIETAASV
jgi:hypothetical protein